MRSRQLDFERKTLKSTFYTYTFFKHILLVYYAHFLSLILLAPFEIKLHLYIYSLLELVRVVLENRKSLYRKFRHILDIL